MTPDTAKSFVDIFHGTELAFILSITVFAVAVSVVSAFKLISIFQQGGYEYKKYRSGLKDTKYRDRVYLMAVMIFLSSLVLDACFSPLLGSYSALLGLISFTLFSILLFKVELSSQKIPLKFTKRTVRLTVLYSVLTLIFSFGLIIFGEFIAYIFNSTILTLFRFSLVAFLFMLLPTLLALSGKILSPFENAKKKE